MCVSPRRSVEKRRGRGRETYLSDEDENDENEADPGAIDAANSCEGNLVNRVAVVSPGSPEADVGNTDATPGEQRGQTGQGDQPVEYNLPAPVQVDVGQQAADEDGNGGPEGTAGLVDVRKELGSIALLSKGGQGTRPTVNTG